MDTTLNLEGYTEDVEPGGGRVVFQSETEFDHASLGIPTSVLPTVARAERMYLDVTVTFTESDPDVDVLVDDVTSTTYCQAENLAVSSRGECTFVLRKFRTPDGTDESNVYELALDSAALPDSLLAEGAQTTVALQIAYDHERTLSEARAPSPKRIHERQRGLTGTTPGVVPQWSRTDLRDVSALTLSVDGESLYVRDTDGLHCLETRTGTGHRLADVAASTLLFDEGTLYAGEGPELVAVDADTGTVRWTFEADATIYEPPAFATKSSTLDPAMVRCMPSMRRPVPSCGSPTRRVPSEPSPSCWTIRWSV